MDILFDFDSWHLEMKLQLRSSGPKLRILHTVLNITLIQFIDSDCHCIHHEYMNLFNKSHSMLVYSLTSATKYGLCLCFNYKILGVPDTVLCNSPGGAVCSG